MSVAEQPVAAKASRNPQLHLALSSLLGAVYVLLALWLVFGGLPYAWGEYVPLDNEFLSSALLLIATIVVGLALWFVGYTLEKNHAQHGLRAGAFLGAVLIFLIAWFCLSVVGPFFETRDLGSANIIVTVGIGLALAYGVFWLFTRPGFSGWLQRWEDHGWFSALPYKPTQGIKVRRGTILGLLVVGACGIITLWQHGSLGRERPGVPNDWTWSIPFSAADAKEDAYIPLMYKVHLVMPLVLGVGLLWLSWRIVSWPVFADFLIATEAEMNKVSWTTRKRLVQDTIVVLVTVFLLTIFIFFTDIVWIKILSNPWFPVLHVDLKAEQLKQQEKSQW